MKPHITPTLSRLPRARIRRVTWFGEFTAHLVLFTPLGRLDWLVGLHAAAHRRWPWLFMEAES